MIRNIRPIRIEGNIAYVPLTRGYEAIIDAADVPLVAGHNWCALVRPHTVYAGRGDCTGPTFRTVQMHRVLMGEPDGLDVDHEDGNGLNNTRDNLRPATRPQNQHNARTRSDNTSGYKGVYWSNREGVWKAQIRINGRRKYLGRHDTPEDAYASYCEASKKYHGEFGRIE
jgi:hypothetical protein